MNLTVKILIVAGLAMAFQKAFTQTIIPSSYAIPKQQVFLTIGLEPEWVIGLGYNKPITDSTGKLDVSLGGSIKFAPLEIDNGAWRINLTTGLDWKFAENWKTIVTNNIYLAHNTNRAGTMNGLGFELRAAPVNYGKNWKKGLDIGWQYTVFTHIKHSAEARATFDELYPNGLANDYPKDGWYGSTTHRFRLGFITSRDIGNHFTFQLGAGGLIALQKQGILLGFSHAQFPIYAEGMLTYHW